MVFSLRAFVYVCVFLHKSQSECRAAKGTEGNKRLKATVSSLTRQTWVWVNSRSWWWTGRPGVLRFMGSQRVGHDWRLNWTDLTKMCNVVLLREVVLKFQYASVSPEGFNKTQIPGPYTQRCQLSEWNGAQKRAFLTKCQLMLKPTVWGSNFENHYKSLCPQLV